MVLYHYVSLFSDWMLLTSIFSRPALRTWHSKNASPSQGRLGKPMAMGGSQ